MDSLSQLTLGAAVGAVVGGRKYGRKAALIGAICGTVPDLDVFFVGDSDPVTAFTYHRGFSHSLIFAILATPILAWLFSKITWFGVAFKDTRLQIMIFLMLFTHIILDALTIYGTQIFWGFGIQPVSVGSIFIIDPSYTLPLLGFLMYYLIKKSVRAIQIGMLLSTLYLGFGLAAQHYVYSVFENNYTTPYKQALVQTTPFNTVLWRILVMTENGYEVGYYSLFDDALNINFKKFKSDKTLIAPIKDSFAVSRLAWFTGDYYSVQQNENEIIMTDLRMGLEPDSYVFGYKVGEMQNGTTIETPNKKHPSTRDMGRIKTLWARIWDADVNL